jgi:hypothetical protein
MIERHFRDWSEYLEALEGIDKRNMERFFRGRGEGPGTWANTLALAYRGWPEGTQHVADITIPQVNIMAQRTVEGSTWTWDVTGANYDVGELLSGVPECWQSVEPTETKPVVKVVVSLGISAGVPNAVITYRGAGIMALVMALQSAGYVVDLVAARHALVYSGGQQTHTQVTISLVDTHGGPLDVDRLAFVLMHPNATRVLFFSMSCHLAGYGDMVGLGPPQQVTETGDLNLPPLLYDEVNKWRTREAVNTWVQEEFNRLTGVNHDPR